MVGVGQRPPVLPPSPTRRALSRYTATARTTGSGEVSCAAIASGSGSTSTSSRTPSAATRRTSASASPNAAEQRRRISVGQVFDERGHRRAPHPGVRVGEEFGQVGDGRRLQRQHLGDARRRRLAGSCRGRPATPRRPGPARRPAAAARRASPAAPMADARGRAPARNTVRRAASGTPSSRRRPCAGSGDSATARRRAPGYRRGRGRDPTAIRCGSATSARPSRRSRG